MRTVYIIVNEENNRVYVGSTVNYPKRKLSHLGRLRDNFHSNKRLQEDFNLYGESSFHFQILESFENISEVDLAKREEFYIHEFNSCDPEKGYNIYSRCNAFSDEAREEISRKCSKELNGNYGNSLSEEIKKKMRDRRYGEDHVNKPRVSSYKKKTVEELAKSREQLSLKMKGRVVPQETRDKISKARQGMKWSQEVKNKFSEDRKGEKNSNSKLSKEQALEIHRLMNEGNIHYSEICEQFNIGVTQAYKIKRKEHWVFRNG